MHQRPLTILFAVTTFIGAFLLFQVQPLLGKYILPWFGGGPGVWTTCMVFFQVMLLMGYLYAYGMIRFLAPRGQMLLHLAVLVFAVGMLPIVPSTRWIPTDSSAPVLRILGLLLATIGPAYLALSATGPLVQGWFNRVWPGESPYRLYALSNIASLLALISYPFLIEPNISRSMQATMWSASLVLFAICCGMLAVAVFLPIKTAAIAVPTPALVAQPAAVQGKKSAKKNRQSIPPVKVIPVVTQTFAAVNAKNIATWIILPALASAMLLAVTSKICQDVATVPLLWILPLVTYLLTFIICFDSPRWYIRRLFIVLTAMTVTITCWVMMPGPHRLGVPAETLVYCGVLFCSCMIYHGELYRLRPAPARLTLFYLMIAAGGALGGILVAIVAPLVFKELFELHLTLLAAMGYALMQLRNPSAKRSPIKLVGMGILGVLAGGTMILVPYLSDATSLARARNFYGVLTVYDLDISALDTGNTELTARKLQHGGITHGIQVTSAGMTRLATTYYDIGSGVGRAIATAPDRDKGLKVAAVGLGIGTVAAYAKPGDSFTFYEINPHVVRFAQEYFTFLKEAAPAKVDIVLGDARMSLQQLAEPQNYDLIILDAFNGDAIPTHLLTREGFEVYLRHLRPGGMIAVHISNLYLDLSPITRRLAEHFKMEMADIVSEGGMRPLIDQSRWVLLSANHSWISSPAIAEASGDSSQDFSKVRLWTDDDTNLFQILDVEGFWDLFR